MTENASVQGPEVLYRLAGQHIIAADLDGNDVVIVMADGGALVFSSSDRKTRPMLLWRNAQSYLVVRRHRLQQEIARRQESLDVIEKHLAKPAGTGEKNGFIALGACQEVSMYADGKKILQEKTREGDTIATVLERAKAKEKA